MGRDDPRADEDEDGATDPWLKLRLWMWRQGETWFAALSSPNLQLTNS